MQLSDYISIVKQKFDYYEKLDPSRNSSTAYLQGIGDEISEVSKELEENKQILLEDELGDVFRDYMNLLYSLEQEGKISGRNQIFERSFQKYTERVSEHVSGKTRKEVKELQKIKLHEEQYYFEHNL